MPKSPLDDEFDRATFYRGLDPDADEVDDYELLPPDEEVIAGEKRRAEQAVEHASKAVELDELYREDTSVTGEDIQEYLKDFRFQFGVKHLLMAMTALALMFVVGRYVFGGFGTLLLVVTFVALASAYTWVTWQEQKRRQEWEHKRDELYRRHQQRHDASIETKLKGPDDDWSNVTRQNSLLADHGLTIAPSLRWHYSVFDLLALVTLLAVVLTMAMGIGLPLTTLLLGGLLAFGTFSYTTLAHPPRALASVMWMLLVMYVAMSFLSLLAG